MVTALDKQAKPFITYNFENSLSFSRKIIKAITSTDDLKVAFFLISEDFYKSERAIFQLKSAGGYVDLNDKYKVAKKRKYGFIYPILKATGKLEKSITTPNSEGSLRRISRSTLEIGSTIPYASYHNSDATRKKIPQRKFVFIGPESTYFHSRDRQNQGGRLTRWTAIIEGVVQSKLNNIGF